MRELAPRRLDRPIRFTLGAMRKRYRWWIAAAALLVACALGARAAYEANKSRIGTRVLFVGNSLTFVNNLPAVFAALSAANGYRVSTEMLVESGAALADRVADRSVDRLLELERFDYVVLQERAGAILCAGQGSPEFDCEPSRRAHRELAARIRAHTAEPVVFGTYTLTPALVQPLQSNENEIAREIGARHAAVAVRLLTAMQAAPELDWLAPDGHPGHDLTLLDAIVLYQALFHARPRADALIANGPIYDVSTAIFDLNWRRVPAAANRYAYDAVRVQRVIDLVTAQP